MSHSSWHSRQKQDGGSLSIGSDEFQQMAVVQVIFCDGLHAYGQFVLAVVYIVYMRSPIFAESCIDIQRHKPNKRENKHIHILIQLKNNKLIPNQYFQLSHTSSPPPTYQSPSKEV